MSFGQYNPGCCCCNNYVNLFFNKCHYTEWGQADVPFWPDYLDAPGSGITVQTIGAKGDVKQTCYPGLTPEISGFCHMKVCKDEYLLFDGGDYMASGILFQTSVSGTTLSPVNVFGSGGYALQALSWQGETCCAPCWLDLIHGTYNAHWSWPCLQSSVGPIVYQYNGGILPGQPVYYTCGPDPSAIQPPTATLYVDYLNSDIGLTMTPTYIPSVILPGNGFFNSEVFLFSRTIGTGLLELASTGENFGQFYVNCAPIVNTPSGTIHATTATLYIQRIPGTGNAMPDRVLPVSSFQSFGYYTVSYSCSPLLLSMANPINCSFNQCYRCCSDSGDDGGSFVMTS